MLKYVAGKTAGVPNRKEFFRPAPITCSPRKKSRFAPLNRFFVNFLVIIYLLVVCKKNNNSFILVYFCQRSQAKLFLQNLQKTTREQ